MTLTVAEKIVSAGANIYFKSIPPLTALERLVSIATKTGAHITIDGSIPASAMEKLAALGKNRITFVD